MAAISDGVLGFRVLSGKTIVCDGGNSLLQKVSGYGSNSWASVSICSYSKYSETRKNSGGYKAVSRDADFISKGSQSRWWLPIFGWNPEEKWAEEESDVQNTRKATDNVCKSDGEKIAGAKQSKFVAVSFTAEKAKLLRKNLRSTSSFHDLMYHSAIASRLASADTSSLEESK